jgi:SAM-dependent methyltransferase
VSAPRSRFDAWIADLERRHLADLTTAEVARALRALSATYVERRARLSGRGAFDTAGKRAAYALYYAPRRFLLVSHVVSAIAGAPPPGRIVDAGCGTGAAGAAWAVQAGADATVLGLDAHPWALDETRATYRALAVAGEARRYVIGGSRDHGEWIRGGPRDARRQHRALVLSYVVNELDEPSRTSLLPALLAAAAHDTRVLVIEPLSRRTSPWWPRWASAVVAAGGRADEWRVALDLPDVTARLGRAAGLDAREATARTLLI